LIERPFPSVNCECLHVDQTDVCLFLKTQYRCNI
jgi:hypothetical protein